MRRAALHLAVSASMVVTALSAGTQAQECPTPPLVLACADLNDPPPPIVCPNQAVEGCWGQLLDIDRASDPAFEARHMILLRNGKLLLVESKAINQANEVRLWEPPAIGADPCDAGDYTQVAVPLDPDQNPIPLYCSAHSQLRDGRIVFVGGGNGPGSPHDQTVIFDPGAGASSQWKQMDDMPQVGQADGIRWYATGTTLGDGTVLVTAGDAFGVPTHTADNPLIFDATQSTNSQYTALTTASKHLPYYPYVYQLSDEMIFYAGFERRNDTAYQTPYPNTQLLDLDTQFWTDVEPQPTTGPAVMYRPDRIMKAGGDSPANDKVWTIDPTVSSPSWGEVLKMPTARGHFHYALLPDGKILAVGGKTESAGVVTEVLAVELYDPDANTWSTMAAMETARSSHATAALLPDGRVVVAGQSTTTDGLGAWCVAVYATQIYSPPYLFAQGTRPDIVSVPVRPPTGPHPATVTYGSTFEVLVPAGTANAVDSISMIRPTGTVHAINFGQRYIPIPNTDFEVKSGTDDTLEVAAPTNQYEAPPGYYLFFTLDNSKVPSEGEFVRLVECGNNVACNDGNDVCTFDQQCFGACSNADASYGDTMTTGGTCGPDGTVGLPDILAVWDAFAGKYAEGCEFHNFDIAGLFGGCVPDGSISLGDIFAVQNAFQGIDPCCATESSQSSGSGGLVGSGGEATISLVPRQAEALAGGLFEVDVLVAKVNDLRGYQLAMEIDPSVANSVKLEAIYVDERRGDYLFAGRDYHHAIDLANGRMVASMVTGGVTPNGRAYLATFAFRVSPDVKASSVLRVLRGGGSIMLDAAGRSIDMLGGVDVVAPVP